ncbi:MAG: DUF2382 domain-containing protein [Scytonematopsis contorta HA4267-MV1]|jgi:stress response protein YsnF|nr:DUF2382 domain-containing protein [Scytonematopsis contorta HA4267-MV1]
MSDNHNKSNPGLCKTLKNALTLNSDFYEETPDIHKETVVREEVRIRKEVETSTAEAQETIRREELDIDSEGRPIVDKRI